MFPDTMTRYWWLTTFIFVFLSGCQSDKGISSEIERSFSKGREIDLAQIFPRDWDRVCVLGPYSNNAIASQTLGFAWDAESQSSIKSDDGISLLVFVQNNTVLASAEHQRRFGDFSNLAGRCFSRNHSRFFQLDKDRPNVVPADEARAQ
jgi:hypothetical protein